MSPLVHSYLHTPSCFIQGIRLGTPRRDLLDEATFQPSPVLASFPARSISAVRAAKKQRIDELKVGATGFGEFMLEHIIPRFYEVDLRNC